MEPSPAERVLDEWQAVAAHARRPAMPVRPVIVRAALPASSVAAVVLVVAAVTAALVGLDRARPPGPPAGGASVSANPTLAVTPTASSSGAAFTPRVAPSSSVGADVECLGTLVPVLDEKGCQRVIRAALANNDDIFERVQVEPYEPGCMRARMCQHPHGDYPFDYLVVATDSAGGQRGWRCSYQAPTATCEIAPPEDFEPLVALDVRVQGVESQSFVLRDPEGTRWTLTALSGPRPMTIMTGRWELLTHRDPCDGCPTIDVPIEGTPPPGWCSARFEAAPGTRFEATITITPGAPCRIEVTGGRGW